MDWNIAAPGMSAGRIAWIDITKAVAAWMVVTSHLLRQGVLTDYLAAISVSIFYVLAGVTMHSHADRRAFLLRLLRRIILPYLAVGCVSIAAYRLLGSYAAGSLGAAGVHTTLRQDLLHLVYGSSVGGRMKWNESLWFLPCYCLMILMAEVIEHTRQVHRGLPIFLYPAGGAIGYLLIQHGVMGLPWHLETALLVLPLCGIGRYLARGLGDRRVSPFAMLFMGGGCLYIGTELFKVAEQNAAGGSLSLRAVHIAGAAYTYGFLMGVSMGMILVIWPLSQRWYTISFLSAFGRRSLDIVLWNKFPVLILQVVVPAICPGFTASFIGGRDVAALITAGILAIPCIVACLVWTRILVQIKAYTVSRMHKAAQTP